MRSTSNTSIYLGSCLEGLLFGFYSGIFALYLRHHACNTDNTKKNILFYALCCLYVFSVALMAIDTAYICSLSLQDVESPVIPANWVLIITVKGGQPVVFAICDFIAQFILIHRCWIVWGRNIRVVIIPTIFAFTFLFSWIVCGSVFSPYFIGPGTTLVAFPTFVPPDSILSSPLKLLNPASLIASMAVNAIVTGLIVFKIFKVFRQVSRQCITASGGRKLRSIIFVMIESGMALFSIQLARLVLSTYPLSRTVAANDLYQIIAHIHSMLNGITPTIILVRVSMGLSFYDEPSLNDTVSNLHFATNDPNSISETTT